MSQLSRGIFVFHVDLVFLELFQLHMGHFFWGSLYKYLNSKFQKNFCAPSREGGVNFILDCTGRAVSQGIIFKGKFLN